MSEPMRLAGIRYEYSSMAIAQLMSMMKISGVVELIIFICCSFRLPYHANVMKVFEMMSSNTVRIALFIFFLFCFLFLLYPVATTLVVCCSCYPTNYIVLQGSAFPNV